MNITANTEKFELDIPHLGLTLRSIMGAAAASAAEMTTYRRRWKLVYKGATIGSIQLATPDTL